MLIGGIVSKASGGSFERGAVTAGVVFLYNDIADAVLKSNRMPVSNIDLISERARLRAIYGYNKKPTLGVSVGGGASFSVHFLVAGVHTHFNTKFLNGKFYTTKTICCRVGPGILLGGGTEYSASIEKLKQSDGFSFGFGGDMMFGTSGTSGSISGNSSGLTVSGSGKLPALSYGIGASVGIDGCYSWVK